MKVTSPLVSIVDDDESVRESLPDLLQSTTCDIPPPLSSRSMVNSWPNCS